MSFQVPFTAKNIIQNGYNNSLRVELSSGGANLKNVQMCIQSIRMYNSQFNIDSQLYGNNTFSIEVPTAATTSTINITLTSGIYSFVDINRSIQQQLIAAGAYLIDANGNNVFYIQLTANSVYYSTQVDCSPTPIAIGTYTRPATGLYSGGGSGLPTTTRTPRLIITNPAFATVLGFALGQYPATSQTTLQSLLSTIAPQINPVSSYMLRCSLINNPYVNPSDSMCIFDSNNTQSGQLINFSPNEFAWIDIPDQSVSSIQLTIVDQAERIVRFFDPQISIVLLFKQKN